MSRKIAYTGTLSRRLLLRYGLSLLATVGAVLFLAGIALLLLGMFDFWRRIPMLDLFVSWCRDYILLLIVLCTLSGWAACTVYFFRLPLKYLDQMVDAAECLAQSNAEAIRLPAELSEAQEHLNAARERALQNARAARDAEQRKNDLIVYLAHDLKTPLTSVIGYLTLLRDEPQLSKELQERYTGVALDKAERLEDLVNEFFDITRFSLTHLELEKQPTDLTRMLEQVCSEFQPMLAERGLKCELHLPQKLSFVGDPDQLARVFDNLLRNACHYSFEDTVVHVSGHEDAGDITLTFTNAGRTISKEKLARIFDQFFRLDSSRASRTGGAGLGLAIAKEIVELHGGTIYAWSENEKIVFVVTLPKEVS